MSRESEFESDPKYIQTGLRAGRELHQKVRIAACGVEVIGPRRRAKYLQATDAVAQADGGAVQCEWRGALGSVYRWGFSVFQSPWESAWLNMQMDAVIGSPSPNAPLTSLREFLIEEKCCLRFELIY